MKTNIKKTWLLILVIALVACGNSNSQDPRDGVYDKQIIASTKLCPQIKYKCLTRPQDPKWRKTLLATRMMLTRDQTFRVHLGALERLFDFYKIDKFHEVKDAAYDAGKELRSFPKRRYELMSKVALKTAAKMMNKTEEEIMSDDVYIMGKEELAAIRREDKERMYIEITKMLDLFYPGFWEDTPLDEQIKWVMQVEKKKEQFPKFGNSQGALETMVEICAIIGIDFDTKPEHKLIYDFLQSNVRYFGSDVLDYLYFVYLERDYSGALHLNDWSMRDALGHLPRPKRHVPSFPDELPDGKAQNFDYDMWRIYKDTIRHGGRPDYKPKDFEAKDHTPILEYMKTLKPVSITINKNKE